MRVLRLLLAVSLFLFAVHAIATIFGSVQGLIHDPQHRPVKGAQVTIHSVASDWRQTATSDDAGEFQFATLPVGAYMVMVQSPGFADQQQNIEITSDRNVKLHYALTVADTKETVRVTDSAPLVNPESSTTQSTVNREQIARTPGADQTNSLAMIADYTPSATMVHDQLHIRGGHQVSWLIDGVPVPNTSIASNVGPQFDPKDIDYLEVQRGGYSADYGDRTYGVFNVVTRSGFERDRQGEVVLGYGSYNNTNDQISFGDHTDRFAYYGSLSGYRTDLGLEAPTTDIAHDQAAGLSGFVSIIFNRSPQDQFRLVTSLRGDHYQVPIDATATDILHDVEDERDDFVNFTWLHNIGSNTLLTISPFYHFNRAHYVSSPDDPLRSEYDRGSNFAGGVATIGVTKRKHNFRAGLQLFGERDSQFYQVIDTTPGSPDAFDPQRTIPGANVETLFFEDQFKATSWLTFNAGVRMTHYGGPESENAADPRIGAAIRIPHLEWVLRGFYGRYYQAPPLVTVTDPALNADQTFLPLRGERDEQHEIGLAIPIKRWTLDLSNFRTTAKNFFDHDVVGNSNVFFPLTLERARIRGWEASINSPVLADRIKFHLAYSNQFAEWSGGITGGLTDFSECDGVLCFLDHDQRNTLSTGFNASLPWRAWMNFNLSFGSGFLNGEGDDDPTHLDPHTTFDLSAGKSFGENFEARVTAMNLSNHRYMLDNSNTFGGTHFVNPREISFQLKYRFHF